jgi:hypothetical protein
VTATLFRRVTYCRSPNTAPLGVEGVARVPAKAFIFVGMPTFLEHFDIGPIADLHESMLDTRLST